MPENNDNVFFVDDDLIEKLMRGDSRRRPRQEEAPGVLHRAGAGRRAGLRRPSGRRREGTGARRRARRKSSRKSTPAWAICASNSRTGATRRAATPKSPSSTPSTAPRTTISRPVPGASGQIRRRGAGISRPRFRSIRSAGRRSCGARLCACCSWASRQQALECFRAGARTESPSHDQALFGKAVALHQLGQAGGGRRDLSQAAARQRRFGRAAGEPDRALRPRARKTAK